jgi:hypothetical protein
MKTDRKNQSHCKKMHMYLPDRSARIQTFESLKEAAKKTGISEATLSRGLKEDKVVKGFFFSREELDDVPDKIVPIDDLQDPEVSCRDWSVHQVNL